jgi:hypothetical protein
MAGPACSLWPNTLRVVFEDDPAAWAVPEALLGHHVESSANASDYNRLLEGSEGGA